MRCTFPRTGCCIIIICLYFTKNRKKKKKSYIIRINFSEDLDPNKKEETVICRSKQHMRNDGKVNGSNNK